jgi:agmatinase
MTQQFGDFEPQFTRPETSAIHILPVPYDGTSTWIKGADKGPQVLLETSFNLEFYDLETNSAYKNRNPNNTDNPYQ